MPPDEADWTWFESGTLELGVLEIWMDEVLESVAPTRICPVAGAHSFTDTWGESRPGGRVHRGTDVHAQWGTPLVAIERGIVLQSGWHRAGGFSVYMLGRRSGDVYYYAHLDGVHPEIEPGRRVELGEPVGRVGMTGNAGTPHLHFGWMPGHGARWIDLETLENPFGLLAGLCDGAINPEPPPVQ
jgi:murein DD-endopeptidase MepM/ murein hydrolase activator NlpD